MSSVRYGAFGPLIGVIYVNNTHCRFLIYSTKNAEVLTYHDLKLRQIIHHSGWLEYDSAEIWKNVKDCMDSCIKNLEILEIRINDIVGIAICTQRGTTVMWDKLSGQALHNAIGWTDCRTVALLKNHLHNVKHNVDYLRWRTGLPLSTCFSALKIKWLQENVPAVALAMEKKHCLFGTLDSWLLWNLTGAEDGGEHATDVTNAGYTMLMNLRTQQWDDKLCRFFHLPMHILPKIRSNSEIFGNVIGGPLNGVPIAGIIGEQQAALLGQLCLKVGQNVCTIDDSCHVLLNTGTDRIDSSNGLLTSIAYKLGPNEKSVYGLEGAVCNAGASVNWLKEKLHIKTEINSNDNEVEVLNTFLGENSLMSSSCSSSMLNENGMAAKRCEVTFVPAFHGLYSPYWRYDARGMIMGLTSQTTAENVAQSAFEATGFQIHEILEAFKLDTPTWDHQNRKKCLTFGGEYSEHNNFAQFIADVTGWILQRPQTTSPSGLGAMIIAGITMKVVTLSYAVTMYTPPADNFLPTTTPNRRELFYQRWHYAVTKCLKWNNFESYEADLALFAQRERDPYSNVRRSIPGSIFIASSFALLLLAKLLQTRSV